MLKSVDGTVVDMVGSVDVASEVDIIEGVMG